MRDTPFSRRELLRASVRGAAVLGGAGLALPGLSWLSRVLGADAGVARAESLDDLVRQAPRARYWAGTATPGGCAACHDLVSVPGVGPHAHAQPVVRCLLCAQGCTIPPGGRGRCRARVNVGGELRTLVYGRPVTVHVDPIEKKPFYHFLPGAEAFSFATSGCPLRCRFCQNWQISQASPEDYSTAIRSPEAMAQAARGRAAPVVAFTYNEPTVFMEYLADTARAARREGLRSVLISCGYMTEDPLREMCEVLDGIKIDLKGFSREFYRTVCDAELDPVLRSIRQIARSGCHLEIVNLVIPTLNDSDAMLTALARWVVQEVGPDVPVHFTRFHPDYQLTELPPTPVATLERARAIAMAAGIRYAFIGNVPGHPGNNTFCPGCGKVVIERSGFFVTASRLKDGHCEACGREIAGVWK